LTDYELKAQSVLNNLTDYELKAQSVLNNLTDYEHPTGDQ